MSGRHAWLWSWFWLLAVAVGAVTDPDIEAKFAAMAEYQAPPGEAYSEEAFAGFLRDLVADVCLEGEGMDHLERLTPLFLYHPDTRKRMLARLDELRANPGMEGARAAEMALVLRVRDASPEVMAGVVQETLRHPGMGDCIRAGTASDLFSILRGLPLKALEPNAEAIAALVTHFDASMTRRALAISSDFLVVVRELQGVLGEPRVNEIQQRYKKLLDGAASEAIKKTHMQDAEGVVNTRR